MKKLLAGIAAAVVMTCGSLPAFATTYQFNAALSQANELSVLTPSTASGVATLFYNDYGTASTADDTYAFSMGVFGLTAAATAFHIHGAASVAENGPVRIALDNAALFPRLIDGGMLLVGAPAVAVPASIPATPQSAVNAGYAAMSFLDMLQGGLAYINVHTAANPAGEVRGQLVQVSAVPEPQTYAMLLTGLGLVGWIGVRRRKAAD